MVTRSQDIPIDPALLEEDDQNRDSDVEDEGSEDEAPSGSGSSSSGLSDGDEDAYVDDDDGEAETREEEGEPIVEVGDSAFTRLAGFVSSRDFQGETSYNLEEQMVMAEGDDDIPGPSRRSARPKRRHKPSHDVQRLVGSANMAYAQGDNERTIELFMEVIRHDPYVISAWTTLGSIYGDMGNHEAARQMKFFAAHVEDEAETWRELASELRQRGQAAQCMYCLRKAIRKDPNDVSTLFELASLYRLQGQVGKAADAFKKIIKLHGPSSRDFGFLAQFHSSLIALDAYQMAVNAYRTAFDYHISRLASPEDPNRTMQLEHVATLVDDLLHLDEYEEAVGVIRRGQRWLQGRGDQTQWDQYDDDREYDPPGYKREAKDIEEGYEGYPLDSELRYRLALLRLRLGDDDEAIIHVEELLNLDVVQYHEIINSLGQALIKREMWEKALECFATILDCEEINDEPSVVYSVGICHQHMKSHNAALEAFQWVMNAEPENFEAKIHYASVLEDTGRKAEALEMIGDVIKARAQKSRDEPPEKAPVKDRMSKVEKAGQKKLAKRVMEDQMRITMQNLWAEVKDAEEGIANGDLEALDRFIDAAGTLVENFRLAKSNFTKSRGVSRQLKQRRPAGKHDLTSEALALQDRLERAMGFEDDTHQEENNSRYVTVRQTSFYGMDTDDWLTLIVKYCCVLMVKGEEDVALDILEHVIWSGLFNNFRCEIILRMAIITCCMRTRGYEKIVDHCRRISQLHQFRHEPLLICLNALSGGGQRAASAWQTLQLQKFMHRELRMHDEIVNGRKATFSVVMKRWTTRNTVGLTPRLGDKKYDGLGDGDQDEDEDDEEEGGGEEGADSGTGGDSMGESLVPKPTKKSPTLNVIYGQLMLAAKAYQSALFYLIRAYELVQTDPYICLLIAQAYMGRVGNRQADNRNYQMAMAMAFLSRYRKYSKKDAASQEEVDYNFGRSFHGVGIIHLAVEHYEKVLTSIQRRMQQAEDPEDIRATSLACETAHNLIIIYAASGSTQQVREKSRWLAI